GLVDLAVRIFYEEVSRNGIRPHRAAAVADRQVVALDTALMLHQHLRPGLKPLSRLTLLYQLGEADIVEDVPEPIVGIARDPAIALCDVAARIYADEFVSAVLAPDTGQARDFPGEMAHQLIKRAQRDALLVPAGHPHAGQIDTELAQPVQVEDAFVLGIVELSA